MLIITAGICWSADGKRLLSSYHDENIYLFDATRPGMDDNNKPIDENVCLNSYRGNGKFKKKKKGKKKRKKKNRVKQNRIESNRIE